MPKRGRQTPTQSFVLPYRKSKAKEAVKLYNSTTRKAQKWQQGILEDLMAVNAKGLWVHTKYGYSVPRRNGKNEVVAIREMWGLKNGEHILHTAHRTSTSTAAWERLKRLLDEANVEYKETRRTGCETIRLKDGGRIDFRTRTKNGGIGEGFDLLVIDEAQEYTDEQESALIYTVSDSKNPQTVFCGTPPTATSSGTVFMKLRAQILSGEGIDSGWAEWSIPDMTEDIFNVSLWYETNPSMGTILTERKIRAEIRGDSVDFNIQRLGLWLKYNQKSAISELEWTELKADSLPVLSGKRFLGIKFGHDGTNVSMSIAIRTDDGRIFVEAIDCRPIRAGNLWMMDYLKNPHVQAVVIDGDNGKQLLKDEMREEHLAAPVLITTKEVIAAGAMFEQALFMKKICHMGQPSLTQSVSNCEKRPIGSNGGFGYKSLNDQIDVSLLESVVLAHWLCATTKEQKKQRVSY